MIEWFHKNYMMLNAGKCHYTYLGGNTENCVLYFIDQSYAYIKEKTMLGIIVDDKLSFYCHINRLRRKTSQKLFALPRIVLYLDLSQKKLFLSLQ